MALFIIIIIIISNKNIYIYIFNKRKDYDRNSSNQTQKNPRAAREPNKTRYQKGSTYDFTLLHDVKKTQDFVITQFSLSCIRQVTANIKIC